MRKKTPVTLETREQDGSPALLQPKTQLENSINLMAMKRIVDKNLAVPPKTAFDVGQIT